VGNPITRAIANGVIVLTSTAEFALHSTLPRPQVPHHRGQLDEVSRPERRPACRHGDEHVRLGGIGPAQGQRVLLAFLVQYQHPTVTPGLAYASEHEALPVEGVERMRYEDSPILVIARWCS
jgi:hypothetical protein